MALSTTLPSPPGGVPVFRSRRPGLLRSLLAKAVSPEESDTAGTIAVSSSLIAGLPGALTAIFGYPDYLVYHPALLHLIMPFWPVIPALAMTGLLSKSPTARFLAAATTGFLAVTTFLAPRLPIGSGVFDTLALIFQTAITGSVALWLLRAARRHFLRGESVENA